jgi:hypothetical protein
MSANPNIRADQIVAMFQRYLSTDDDAEISKLTLQEIQSADEQLGQRDVGADFRIAMQNRIAHLQLIEQRQHESKIRAWNLVTGIIIGLAIAGLSILLFGR